MKTKALETLLNNLPNGIAADAKDDLAQLQAENARLREALEAYHNECCRAAQNLTLPRMSVLRAAISLARQALASR